MRSLSGGERNRLLLARLFARPANVLVLDEPTNDLDIDTLELLEDLLQDYDGTVFLVSHDRAFLDNVVTSTIAFEGDGRWREYEGGVGLADPIAARANSPRQQAAARLPVRAQASRGAAVDAAARATARSSATRNSANWRPCPRQSTPWSRNRPPLPASWPMAACSRVTPNARPN